MRGVGAAQAEHKGDYYRSALIITNSFLKKELVSKPAPA